MYTLTNRLHYFAESVGVQLRVQMHGATSRLDAVIYPEASTRDKQSTSKTAAKRAAQIKQHFAGLVKQACRTGQTLPPETQQLLQTMWPAIALRMHDACEVRRHAHTGNVMSL